jgi:phosphatidate cytidylyltransferase
MDFLIRTLYAIPMGLAALALGVFNVGKDEGFMVLANSVLFGASFEVMHLLHRRLTSLSIRSLHYALSMISCLVFILLHSSLFLHSVLYLRTQNLILYLFLVVWTTDICALLVGKFSNALTFYYMGLKGPRLLRFISKHKTISGCVGGICGGTIVGCLVLTYPHFTLSVDTNKNFLLLSFLTSVAAVLGDLAESAFKRACFSKDSNVLIKIPGHGGILDRVDSILVAAPMCFALCSRFQFHL